MQSQRFTLLDEVLYHQVILAFWNKRLLYYSSASQILADFGAHLSKFKHASNRPEKRHGTSPSSFINFCSPHSPTCMGPLHCFVLCRIDDCGKNCQFRHICEIHQIPHIRQLLEAPFIALCFALLVIVAKLSVSSYLPNSPTCSPFCHFCFCVHFWTYLY